MLAAPERVDHVEIVEIDAGEVVLFWDLLPRDAKRVIAMIRADLVALDAASSSSAGPRSRATRTCAGGSTRALAGLARATAPRRAGRDGAARATGVVTRHRRCDPALRSASRRSSAGTPAASNGAERTPTLR